VHESFLRYRRFRYLKVALLGIGASVIIACLPSVYRRTDVVYGLGILSAALMTWLVAYGHRKRRYSTSGAPLRGWLSAHVYLGVLPLFLVPIHASFRFGVNVHTLAYVLVAVVILSGLVGATLYATLPVELTRNRGHGKLDDLLGEVAKVDAECEALRANLAPELANLVQAALATRIGGGLLRAILAPRGKAMERALSALEDDRLTNRETIDRLLPLMSWRLRTSDQIRRELRMRSLLDAWLLAHSPIAFAALTAVAVHVIVILRYQ